VSGPLAVLAAFAVLTATGLGTLTVFGVAGTPRELVGVAGLAPLAGMALTGSIGALLATVHVPLGVAGAVVVGIATIAVGTFRLRPTVRTSSPPAPRIWSPVDVVLVAGALVAIAVVCIDALRLFRLKGLAEYDGWAIWGMKARALATVGPTTDVFASGAYGRLHLEYPLLVPGLHALSLQAAAGYSSNTIVLSCFAIGLAGLVALWSLLRDRVRPVVLLPFLAALATMPAFFGQLATGYADVPLAVFVAAGVVALSRWLVDDERPWLLLATLYLAAAVLTKNEGLLFAAAAYAALFAVALGRRRAVLASAGAVALVYAPWRRYVSAHHLGAPDYDLSKSFDLSWVAGRLDRAPPAAHGLLVRMLDRERVSFVLVLAVVVVVCALVRGHRRLSAFAAGFGILSFAGLTWIYVLTPYELSSFLSTNADRVVLSVIVALGALAPLLVEESVRLYELRGDTGCPVGPPR
jgi:hypothetical protein